MVVLDVGWLNVLLNVVFIPTTFIAYGLVAYLLQSAALYSLSTYGHSPALYEPDARIWRLPENYVRLFRSKHFAYYLIHLLSFLIGVCLIVAQFGVDVSNRCEPAPLPRAPGLCAFPNGRPTLSSQIATALYVLSIPWDPIEITEAPIVSGIRKQLSGDESLFATAKYANKHAGNGTSKASVIVDKCSSSAVQPLPAQTEFSIGRHPFWGWAMTIGRHQFLGWAMTAVANATSPRPGGKGVGEGAIIGNQAYESALFVEELGRGKAMIYEYVNAEQILAAKGQLRKARRFTVRLLSKDPIFRWVAQCETVSLSPAHFQRALLVLRTIQLGDARKEHPRRARIFQGKRYKTPIEMSAAEIKRAVISFMVADISDCDGVTWAYKQCGIVHPKLLIPFIVICVLVGLCSAISYLKERVIGGLGLTVPCDAEEWGKFEIELEERASGPKSEPPEGTSWVREYLVGRDEDGDIEISLRNIALRPWWSS